MFSVNTEKLLALLASRNLSQRQFCLQTGLNAQTVAKIIRGNSKVTIKVIGTIATFFNVPLSSIIGE